MGTYDIFSTIMLAVAGIVASAGWALTAVTPPEYRAAKYLFGGAGATAVGSIAVWGGVTDVNVFQRVTMVVLLGGLCLSLAVEATRWATAKESLFRLASGAPPAMSTSSAPAAPATAPNITVTGAGSGVSYGQTGGITAGTIIVQLGPQRLSFTQDLADKMLAKMPDKSKRVHLEKIGNATDKAVGEQFGEFFESKDFVVDRFNIDMKIPAPDQKLSFADTGKTYEIIVAPSAN